MKLHAPTLSALNTFTGYGPGFVLVNDERHQTSLIVMPEHLQPWDARDFSSLEAAHFGPILAINTAIYWHALRKNGIADKVPGWGSLLERY